MGIEVQKMQEAILEGSEIKAVNTITDNPVAAKTAIDGKFPNANIINEKLKNQKTGVSEKLPQEKINNIVNFINTYDASEYTISGLADGQGFIEGPLADQTRLDNENLRTDLTQKGLNIDQYANTPNAVLALNRALTVLSQLSQDSINIIKDKLLWNINPNNPIGGDFRSGGLEARVDGEPFDMTQTRTPEKKETKKKVNEFAIELQNKLKRIDFILAIPGKSQVGRDTTFYYQKQVNTDGKSRDRTAMTPITYKFTQKHINALDLGKGDFQDTSSRLSKTVNNVFNNGRQDKKILADLNGKDGLYKNIDRKDAAKIYLDNIDTLLADKINENKELASFAAKVEKSLGKGGFKQLLTEISIKTIENDTTL